MNSCLYKCEVMHRRIAPKRHAFKYGLFMFYIDLDELDVIDREFNSVGRNRFAPYEFRDKDHYSLPGKDIRGSITHYLAQQGITETIGKIFLLTHLRTWGHLFNPVSFYFIFNESGNEIGSIAEVGNTFGEQKLYFSSKSSNEPNVLDTIKNFYVSPFSELDTTFHFRMSSPKSSVRIAISQSKKGSTYFNSILSGTQRPLTGTSLAMSALRFPFLTIQIVAAIHWQAFLLFLKGAPYQKKSANPHLQTGRHPHLTNEPCREH